MATGAHNAGDFPVAPISRNMELALRVFEEKGGADIVNGSFTSMPANHLAPWFRNVVEHLGPAMFRDVARPQTEVSVRSPELYPHEARFQPRAAKQYNAEFTFRIVDPDRERAELFHQVFYVPVPIGSGYCHTKGKSAAELDEMGSVPGDLGGYFYNARGSPVLIRNNEKTHPSMSIVSRNEKALGEQRKRFAQHYKSAPRVIRDTAEHFGYKGGEAEARPPRLRKKGKPAAAAAEIEELGGEPKPKRAGRPATSRAAMAAILGGGAPPTAAPGAPAGRPGGPARPAPPLGEGALGRLRLAREVLGAKKKKGAAPDPMDSVMAHTTFETVFGQTVTTRLVSIGSALHLWVSLPAVNRRLAIPLDTHVRMELGVTAFAGPLYWFLHALFWARDWKGDAASVYSCMRAHYDEEIALTIREMIDPRMAQASEALLSLSRQEYLDDWSALTPFELFASFYSLEGGPPGSGGGVAGPLAVKMAPSDSLEEIAGFRQMVEYVVDYVAPAARAERLWAGTGAAGFRHVYGIKARGLGALYSAYLRGMETSDTSNLHLYARKAVTTAGTNVFRYIRERLVVILWALAARITSRNIATSGAGAEFRKAYQNSINPRGVLASFRPQDAASFKNPGAPQSVLNLPFEALAKQQLLIRSIATPGSRHTAQEVRLVQVDQLGNADPTYTPESGDVGLRKDGALGSYVSKYRDRDIVIDHIRAGVSQGEISLDAGGGHLPLFVENLPVAYAAREAFRKLRDYFQTNGPVREGHALWGRGADPRLRQGISVVETWDVVFAEEPGRLVIYHTGGILGHLALKTLPSGILAIDDPALPAKLAKAGAPAVDPWREAAVDDLIDAGALAFYPPVVGGQYELSSPEVYYARPSEAALPPGTPTPEVIRDWRPDALEGSPGACRWCWHRTDSLDGRATAEGRPAAEDAAARERYGPVRACAGCNKTWHAHCWRTWAEGMGQRARRPEGAPAPRAAAAEAEAAALQRRVAAMNLDPATRERILARARKEGVAPPQEAPEPPGGFACPEDELWCPACDLGARAREAAGRSPAEARALLLDAAPRMGVSRAYAESLLEGAGGAAAYALAGDAVRKAALAPLPSLPDCLRESVDYVMIHPSCILGASSGTVPLADCCNGVRTAYQANMGVGAMAVMGNAWALGPIDTKVALYGQVPLVYTAPDRLRVFGNASGTVPIMLNQKRPDNNEDGILVSSFFARQALRYQNYVSAAMTRMADNGEIRDGGEAKKVASWHMGVVPGARFRERYHAINDLSGLPVPGSYVRPGEAVWARYVRTADDELVDQSLYATVDLYGMVASVRHAGFKADPGKPWVPDRNSTVSVTLVTTHHFADGDKMCARYSQKGVVARVYPIWEMGRVVGGPFDGCYPDIVTSPAFLPTRITPNLVMEGLGGKLAVLDGAPKDATAFKYRLGLPDEALEGWNRAYADFEAGARAEREGHAGDAWAMAPAAPGGMSAGSELFRFPDGRVEPAMVLLVHYLALRHTAPHKAKRGVPSQSIPPDLFRAKVKGREGNLRIGTQESHVYAAIGANEMYRGLVANTGAGAVEIILCSECGTIHTLATGGTCRVCGSKKLRQSSLLYPMLVLNHILHTQGINVSFVPK
jgi:hypothetical protein